MKKKRVVGALLVGACLFIFKKISHSQLLRGKTIVVMADPLFSQDFKNYLQACFLEQQKVAGQFNGVVRYLKERYKALKTVSIAHNQKKITVKIGADSPIAIINEQFCLTDAGNIVPAYLYQKTVIAQLPAVTVKQDSDKKLLLSDACLRFIKKLDKKILKEYNLTWHDEQNITLQDKQERYSFAVTAYTQLDQQFFATAQVIKNENSVPPKRYCSVDMRFKNQIIVKNNRGQWG